MEWRSFKYDPPGIDEKIWIHWENGCPTYWKPDFVSLDPEDPWDAEIIERLKEADND